MSRYWTPEADALLTELYSSRRSAKTIARTLERTAHEVRARIRKLGLHRAPLNSAEMIATGLRVRPAHYSRLIEAADGVPLSIFLREYLESAFPEPQP